MSDIEVRNDPEQDRYVTEVDGREAVLGYSRDGDRIRLHHTRVPPALEGRGIGSGLARHALDRAREEGLRVRPDCPFVAEYIRRHPEYLDVVDEDYPGRDQLQNDQD